MSKTKKYKDDVKWSCNDCDEVEYQPPSITYIDHACGGGASAKIKPFKMVKMEADDE